MSQKTDKEIRKELAKVLFDEIKEAHLKYTTAFIKAFSDEDQGTSINDIIHMERQAIIIAVGLMFGITKNSCETIENETEDRNLARGVQATIVGGAMLEIQEKVLPSIFDKECTLDILRFMLDKRMNGKEEQSLAKRMMTPDIGSSFKEMMGRITK